MGPGIQSWSADRLVGGSVVILAAIAAGCGEEAQAPTSPEPIPALAAVASDPLTFVQVSGGYGYTCGITPASRALCWGSGLLGNGVAYRAQVPVEVAGGHSFRQISAGWGHTCAITSTFRAYCWGRNYSGQLGDGSFTDRFTPVPVAGGRQFRAIAAGTGHTCAVGYSDRRAYCWGENSTGQLGDRTSTDRLRPVAVSGELLFRQVTVGFDHTCGVTTADRVYCWGSDKYGQIGDGSDETPRRRPTRVSGDLLFRQLDAGHYHTCALTTGSRAYCWGEGDNGQIGDGKALARFTPRPVVGGISFDRLSVGGSHSCGETNTNRAYCWGINLYGMLGDGTLTRRLTPVAVVGGLSFVQLGAGAFHTCGVASGGAGYCWGYNWYAQLGDGTITDRSRPVRVIRESLPRTSETSIIADSPDPSAPGAPVTVEVFVSGAGGVPTGTVRVSSSDGAACSASLILHPGAATGTCTLTFSSRGAHTLTAAYSGDEIFAPSSGTESHQVN